MTSERRPYASKSSTGRSTCSITTEELRTKSLMAHLHEVSGTGLPALGFNLGRNGVHTARTIMLQEISALLSDGKTVPDREGYVTDYPLLPVRRRFWERILRAVDSL